MKGRRTTLILTLILMTYRYKLTSMKESTKERKDSMTRLVIDAHYEWYKVRNDGLPPVVGVIDAAAAKKIGEYLYRISKEAHSDLDDNKLNEIGMNGFMYILTNWDKMKSPYLKRCVRLRDIYSNITNIIEDLKHDERNRKKEAASVASRIEKNYGQPESGR